MGANTAQRLIELLNRLCGPRNRYFESIMRSPAEAFEYSIRSGKVVYEQFHGFNDFTDKVVLDFGCGAGGKTVYYATQGARRTIGVDHAPDAGRALDYARKRHLPVELIPFTDGGGIPLPDDTCDVAINSSVLEHVDDLPRAFGEIRRVLKPGGLLLNRWHPFRSRHGAHLGAAIGIPFAHLLFREVDLVRVYYRSIVRRFGEVPPVLGRVNAHSTTFADLTYFLNRRSTREMRRAIEHAGFELRVRRHFLGKRQVRYSQYLPEAWADYVIDYDVLICVSRKRASERLPSLTGAPPSPGTASLAASTEPQLV